MRQSVPRTIKVGSTPTNITLEIEIDKPIEAVWADFAQIGNIYMSAPTVGHSHLMQGNKHGIGAKRHMDMSLMPGAVVHEQVIGWEDGVFMELEMVKIKCIGLVEALGKQGLVGLINGSFDGRWALHGAHNYFFLAFIKPVKTPRIISLFKLISRAGAEFEGGGGLTHGVVLGLRF